MNGGRGFSYEIALRWMPLDLTDDKSTLFQVMAWCHQATSHYLSQCWSRSMSPNGVTRPQWVNSLAYERCGRNFTKCAWTNGILSSAVYFQHHFMNQRPWKFGILPQMDFDLIFLLINMVRQRNFNSPSFFISQCLTTDKFHGVWWIAILSTS